VSWLVVRSRRDADPLARPASRLEDLRDPFGLSPRVADAGGNDEANQEDDEQRTQVVEQPTDPARLGLVLDSIAYSNSRRFAQINGRTVRERDQVPLGSKDAPGPKVMAKVVSIGRNDVKLEISGRQIELKLEQKTLGDNEVVERLR